MMRTDDRLVQEAFAVAKAAYGIETQALAEYRKSLLLCEEMCRQQDSEIERLQSCLYAQESVPALYDEIKRLQAALQDVTDLAYEDAPLAMIIDVCNRALGVSHD